MTGQSDDRPANPPDDRFDRATNRERTDKPAYYTPRPVPKPSPNPPSTPETPE